MIQEIKALECDNCHRIAVGILIESGVWWLRVRLLLHGTGDDPVQAWSRHHNVYDMPSLNSILCPDCTKLLEEGKLKKEDFTT